MYFVRLPGFDAANAITQLSSRNRLLHFGLEQGHERGEDAETQHGNDGDKPTAAAAAAEGGNVVTCRNITQISSTKSDTETETQRDEEEDSATGELVSVSSEQETRDTDSAAERLQLNNVYENRNQSNMHMQTLSEGSFS